MLRQTNSHVKKTESNPHSVQYFNSGPILTHFCSSWSNLKIDVFLRMLSFS